MKLLLSIFLLLSIVYAQEKKNSISIGAGPYLQTQPYKNVKSLVVPSPVVFFDNGLFYVRWTQVGMYFYGQKSDDFSWGFSLTGQPRPNNYKASDSKELQGLEDKKSSFEAGIAFSATYGDTFLDSMLVTDILDRYDSWIFKTELGTKYQLYDFTFYPSLIAIYQSSDFINYYYGVTQKEASSSQYNPYSAQAGLQLGAQTYIKYPITQQFSTLINMRVDRLSKQATNSPIVSDNYIYSGLVSLIYTFEY